MMKMLRHLSLNVLVCIIKCVESFVHVTLAVVF